MLIQKGSFAVYFRVESCSRALVGELVDLKVDGSNLRLHGPCGMFLSPMIIKRLQDLS